MQSQKCLTIVILNWLRPDNIKRLILPQLSSCPLIGEIIISHGRRDTMFSCYSKNIPIIHRDDSENNTSLGLSLRFHIAQDANYPIIVTIDDDLVVHSATLINMLKVYQQNTPCIVGRFGRIINRNMSYNHMDPSQSQQETPIALTSLLMMSRELCLEFIRRQTPLLDFVHKFSKPLWNGEDIFISLLSIILYEKWPIITNNHKYFPVKKLRSKEDQEVAISQQAGHISYRSELIRNITTIFRIHPSLLLSPPKGTKIKRVN